MGRSFKHGDGNHKGHRTTHREKFNDGEAEASLLEDSRPPRQFPKGPRQTRETVDRGESSTKRLASTSFRGDGKIFYLDAVENERGQALRIAEVSKGKRTIILIPASLLIAFEGELGKVTPSLVGA